MKTLRTKQAGSGTKKLAKHPFVNTKPSSFSKLKEKQVTTEIREKQYKISV